MKLTNKYDWPEVVVDAVETAFSKYDPGRGKYSATGLIKPPRIIQLERRHGHKVEEDVSRAVYAFLGTTIHEKMEEHARSVYGDDVENIEERLYAEVEGVLISGQPDLVVKGELIDYKLMSVWEAIHGLREEKEQQANILAFLLRENGYEVKSAKVMSIYRDWTIRRVDPLGEDNYPTSQIELHDIKIWDHNEAREFITQRVRMHEAAEGMSDNDLPFCTPEELWADPRPFAVMQYKGKSPVSKRARKLFADLDEAKEWVLERGEPLRNGRRWVVERRPITPERCEFYCSVAPFCNQWLEWRENNERGMVSEFIEVPQPEQEVSAAWAKLSK